MPTMITPYHKRKRENADEWSLETIEVELNKLRLKDAEISARINEGEVIVDTDTGRGRKYWNYGHAVTAFKMTRVDISSLERLLAQRRKEQRITEHEAQAGTGGSDSKAKRQKELAELFQQVCYEELAPVLFDELMREAKRRRRQ